MLCFSGCMTFLYRYISGIMCYNGLTAGISRGGIFDTGFSLNTAENEKIFKSISRQSADIRDGK